MIRVERETKARACMACGEVRDTVLVTISPPGAPNNAATQVRLCIARCLSQVQSLGHRVANGKPGEAETVCR